jgi:hypothetical protein
MVNCESLPLRISDFESVYQRIDIFSCSYSLEWPPGEVHFTSGKTRTSQTNFCNASKEDDHINLPLLLIDKPCIKLISADYSKFIFDVASMLLQLSNRVYCRTNRTVPHLLRVRA